MSISPGAALGLFAVLSLAAGVILWHLDRRTALQIEWNPWVATVPGRTRLVVRAGGGGAALLHPRGAAGSGSPSH